VNTEISLPMEQVKSAIKTVTEGISDLTMKKDGTNGAPATSGQTTTSRKPGAVQIQRRSKKEPNKSVSAVSRC